jgi:rod shape-determining protein MreD
MRLTVAAISAIAAALLEVSVLSDVRIGEAHPDIVLVGAVVWTFVAGFEGALVWAFVGGLMLDILAGRPLGSTAFVLLICVGLAAPMARVLEPARFAAPALAMFPLAIVYVALPLIASVALRGSVPIADRLGSVAPRIVVDSLLAGIVGGAILWSRRHRAPSERVNW